MCRARSRALTCDRNSAAAAVVAEGFAAGATGPVLNQDRRDHRRPEARADRESGLHQPLRQGRQRRTPVQFQRPRRRRRSGSGKVGVGLGKAGEVADAIRKGGLTWPARPDDYGRGPQRCRPSPTKCPGPLLRRQSPAPPRVPRHRHHRRQEPSARSSSRLGIKDVLSKSLGSKNAANVVKATLDALLSLRLREDILWLPRPAKSRNRPRRPPLRRPLRPPLRLRLQLCLAFYAITRS